MRATLASLLLSTTGLCLIAGAAVAEEVEFPTRQPGMWEIQADQGQAGAPNMSIKACIDEASDKQMMAAGLSMSKSMCSEQTMTKDGDSLVIDATCQIAGMSTKSHTVMSGDFQSSYQVVTTSEVSGMPSIPGMPSGPTTMTQTATWKGTDCTDGLKPGDMLMPGGMKVNVTDMMKMMGGG